MNKYYSWLPSVEKILNQEFIKEFSFLPRSLIVDAIRDILNEYRLLMRNGQCPYDDKDILQEAINKDLVFILQNKNKASFKRVINATGIVLHTNIGRAPISIAAQKALLAAAGYCNLEIDLEKGSRGSRYSHLEDLLLKISGAEACLVVNNNAAAVLLALDTMGKNQEVLISRGELVEIGGSFRIPEIIAGSGCLIREIGTTNKTYLADYQKAITENTALILRVHRSNFAMTGFTEQPSLGQLKELANEYGLPLLDDLGSGCFYPLAEKGIGNEPTVAEEIAAGVDILMFSGDKLLGGPQAGIIVGKKKYIDAMKKNNLLRALRADKFTIAALEATLRSYLDLEKAAEEIPLLAMLLKTSSQLAKEAGNLLDILKDIPSLSVSEEKGWARVGGGALPDVELPAFLVTVSSSKMSAAHLSSELRLAETPVLTYIRDGKVIFDIRTVSFEEQKEIQAILQNIFQ